MPERETIRRARRDRRQGKAASTQAGEFVREEMHHIREGKHGARSAKQAIAIGLSKARRAGVNLRPPRRLAHEALRRRAADLACRASAAFDAARWPFLRSAFKLARDRFGDGFAWRFARAESRLA